MKKDIYAEITNRIVDLMEAHGTDWSQPWKAALGSGGQPRNAITNRAYSGVNILILAMSGQDDPRWATYKQWAEAGAQVRKGEKSTAITFFKKLSVEDKSTGERKSIPLLRTFNVFSASQVDGWAEAELPVDERTPLERCAEVDHWVEALGTVIDHGGNRAYYGPSTDHVQMPPVDSFKSTEGYYSTLLHEIVHWTSEGSRCDRKLGSRFGDDAYAVEELVAEIGSAFLCCHHGIIEEPRPDHAKYLNSWLRVLKNDKKALFSAAAAAQRATTWCVERAAEGGGLPIAEAA